MASALLPAAEIIKPGTIDYSNSQRRLDAMKAERTTKPGTTGIISANTLNIVDPPVTPDVYGTANIATSQQDLGISSGAVGSRKELSGMLQSYLGRSSLIQGAQRQKAIFTIDRFDGGINLNDQDWYDDDEDATAYA